MTHEELEEGKVLKLDFAKLRKVANCESDVLPAIAQDASTGEVCDVTAENIMEANDWWGPATFGPGLDCPGGDDGTTGTK